MTRQSTGLDNSSRERLIVDHVEPQPRVRLGQHLPQQGVTLPGDHSVPGGNPTCSQVELTLTRMQPIPGGRQQRGQIGVGVRRTQMFQHLVPPCHPLRDLHSGGARRGLDLPHERHDPDQTDPLSVSTDSPTGP